METNSVEIEIDKLLDESSTIYTTNHKYARSLTEQALSLSNSCNYEAGIALAQNLLGDMDRIRGNHNKALYFYKASLELYKKLSISSKICSCYTNIGVIYVNLGKLEQALDYFNYALEFQMKLHTNI